MTHVEHGFDLPAVRAALDAADWEPDYDNPGTEERRVWLGTTFGLTPSGKFYAPFACGNLDVCVHCKGSGTRAAHKRPRIAKRWSARALRIRRIFDRRLLQNESSARRWLVRHQAWRLVQGPSCTACGGLGSREAYLDELWNEAAEAAIESIGAGLVWDSGDAFACESRDEQEPEDDEQEQPHVEP